MTTNDFNQTPSQYPQGYGTPVQDNSQFQQKPIPPLKPANWLWQSILATVLCCLPFGIVGIIFATKVDSHYYSGRYAEAENAARKAKMWTIISAVSALLYFIILMILMSMGFMDDFMNGIIDGSASGYNY